MSTYRVVIRIATLLFLLAGLLLLPKPVFGQVGEPLPESRSPKPISQGQISDLSAT